MSYGTLPKPGSKLGPCAQPCNHVDCVLTRKDATVICRYCTKPIGYGAQYYRIGGMGADLVHVACAEDAR